MKKHPIKAGSKPRVLRIIYHDNVYEIPRKVVEKYRLENAAQQDKSVLADEVFVDSDREHTKAGALLRGVRYRENLSQAEFAKRIGVTQSDLSKMENGKRPIGKIIAKRIAAEFHVNYRYFLE